MRHDMTIKDLFRKYLIDQEDGDIILRIHNVSYTINEIYKKMTSMCNIPYDKIIPSDKTHVRTHYVSNKDLEYLEVELIIL